MSTPSSESAPSASNRTARFVRGARLGLPIFLGYVPVGAAFGVIARTVGFSITESVVCSATALAGAGQFIAMSLAGAGSGVIALLIATTVVNLRYVLFGATISPYLRGTSLPTQAALAFSLTDETFAVNISDQRQGLATPASMAGVGAIAWCGWVLGTFLGAAGTSWIGDPSRWGVEFAMPAMFTALFVALAEDRRHVIVGALAALIAVALPALSAIGIDLESSWFIVLAAMGAATAGSVIYR